MNRAIYYRNLFVFIVFVGVIFATPYLFAQGQQRSTTMSPTTSPTLLRLNRATTQLYDQKKLIEYQQKNSRIKPQHFGRGTVIRLPNPVIENAVYDINNNINMEATLRVWHSLAAEDKRLIPRSVNGRPLYPVKILRSSDENFNVHDEEAIGYMPLEDLMGFKAFDTIPADEELLMASPLVPDQNPVVDHVEGPKNTTIISISPRPVARPRDSDESSFDDTTTTDGFDNEMVAIAPQTRDGNPLSLAPSMDSQWECTRDVYRRNSRYQGRGRGFETLNCFTDNGYTWKQKAEHVMGDFHAMNLARGHYIDPRFSLCINAKETGSTLANNTLSASKTDFGLIQVIDGTGHESLEKHGLITPGFENYRPGNYSMSSYRRLRDSKDFISNYLAQIDLQHSILRTKAGYADIDLPSYEEQMSIPSRRLDSNDYWTLAKRYNGASSYANKVIECYNSMIHVATPDGRIRPGKENLVRSTMALAH